MFPATAHRHTKSRMHTFLIETLPLQAIVDNPDEPTFANVFAALDYSGEDLDKISMLFSNLTSSLNTEPLQASPHHRSVLAVVVDDATELQLH